MSLLGALPTKPDNFKDAVIGSLVTVTPISNPRGAFQGRVIAADMEAGRLGQPQLLVRIPGDDDPKLVSDNGLVRLKIDEAAEITGLVGVRPDSAIDFTPKPAPITATMFAGTVESAAELVRWTAGTGTTLAFKQATDVDPVHLEMFSGSGQGRLYKGDWLVLAGEHFAISGGEELSSRYEPTA